MRTINKIIIHCSATPPSMDIGAEEMRVWHTQPWLNPKTGKLRYMGNYYGSDEELPHHVQGKRGSGFTGLGYHYVDRRNGLLEDGRPLSKVGAHATPWNEDSIGICMIGGVTEKNKKIAEANFTRMQWATIDDLVSNLLEDYPDSRVLGHRDVPGVNKACPSFDAHAWWYGVNS